jgi:rod shape-determining protein MreC
MAPERFTSRWDTLAIVVCVLLAIAARAVPASVQDAVASAVRRTVAVPLLALEHQTELLRSSRARLHRLVSERDSALVLAIRADALGEENDRLRELLALRDRLGGRAVAAEVLRQSGPTAGLTLVLTAGSSSGVRPLTPMVAPGGLLGVVRSVDPSYAVAVLWTHPDFRVGAMTLDGSVFGLVAPAPASGPETMLLQLTGVPYRDLVPPGTRLYTSGFGGVYPRGIPIGEVLGVAREQEGVSRTYMVRPAVRPGAVAHVILLVAPDLDVSAAFGGGGGT